MDFLKDFFKDKALTFDELVQAINAHNGNEANKDSQIKIGNLGSGEYVGKGKHDSEVERLNTLLTGKETELQTANGLIAELQKATKGNEDIQGQITTYQDQVKQLQEQLIQTQIDSGLKIAFMEAGGTDIDYLIWKAKQGNGGKPLELGEDGKIKGIDDLVSGLKTSDPNHFKTASGIQIEANPLPTGEQGKAEPKTLAEALQMQYENKSN